MDDNECATKLILLPLELSGFSAYKFIGAVDLKFSSNMVCKFIGLRYQQHASIDCTLGGFGCIIILKEWMRISGGAWNYSWWTVSS